MNYKGKKRFLNDCLRRKKVLKLKKGVFFPINKHSRCFEIRVLKDTFTL